MNLAILAIILFVVSMQPSLYAEFRGIMMFSRPNFQSILPRLYNLAGKADIAPMKKMVEAVLSANDRLKDRKKLNRYLKELSESNACVGSDEKGANLAYYPKTDGVQRVWSNPISDNLICSKGSDDMWRYYNKDGSQAFEGVFHRAEDFMEGRAEVTVGYYQGLINRSGEFIIDAVCEEVRWYGDNGVALVTIDGVMELRDRNSNVVKRLDCDWVGVLYNGLFPAKSDAKYGYIDLKGDTVIEFIYDEAFSFNNGRALVIKDNCECYIDTCGNRINV